MAASETNLGPHGPEVPLKIFRDLSALVSLDLEQLPHLELEMEPQHR
jgi:hypothetical protein